MEYQKCKHPTEQQAIINAVSLKEAVNFCTKGVDDTLSVLAIAEIFRNWLNTVSESKVKTSTKLAPVGTGVNCPTPTLEQKKVLDEIVKRSGKADYEVYPKVLEWVKQTYNADQYPQLMSSVSQFLEWVGWN